jgi:hypothetical protein
MWWAGGMDIIIPEFVDLNDLKSHVAGLKQRMRHYRVEFYAQLFSIAENSKPLSLF